MLSEEAANTNLIVFGLTLPGFETEIYCEHANHYNTDTVKGIIEGLFFIHQCTLMYIIEITMFYVHIYYSSIASTPK